MEMGAAKIWKLQEMLFFPLLPLFSAFLAPYGSLQGGGGSLVAFLARAPQCFSRTRFPADVFIGITQDVLLEGTRKEGQVLKLSNEEFLKSASRWRTLLRGTHAVACGLFWTLTTQWNFLLSYKVNMKAKLFTPFFLGTKSQQSI